MMTSTELRLTGIPREGEEEVAPEFADVGYTWYEIKIATSSLKPLAPSGNNRKI